MSNHVLSYQYAVKAGAAMYRGIVYTEGDRSRRVLRGGPWYLEPWDLRSSDRYWGRSDARSDGLGFRVA